MFKKIFNFITEYVIIEITGKNKERFINMCLYKGIKISDCTPYENSIKLTMPRSDFKNLRSAVRKSGVKVRILEKHGKRIFVQKHRNRIGFLVAGVIIIALGLISSQFIWCVELDGIKRADRDEVIEILQKSGVYVGARKSKIADLGEIKKDIIGTDDINWAWLYIEGTKARLAVQETTPRPDVVDKTTPTDIIAMCDGYLTEATVRRGERRVNRGMTVSEGEVLVSGKVPVFIEGEEERYSYVNADGVFYADTVRKQTGVFSKNEIIRIRTGRKKTRFSFDILGREFSLSRGVDKLYECYDIDVSNHDLNFPFFGYTGLSVSRNTVYEIKEVKNTLTEDEVLSRAKEALEERIMKGVGTGAIKNDENITYTKSGDTYTVTLTMYLRENIGIEIPRER